MPHGRPTARTLIRRGTLAAGSAGLAMLGTAAFAAPAVAPAAAQVVRLQPAHLVSHSLRDHLVGTPEGRGSSRSSAASSSSVCWESSNWSGYAVASAAPSGSSCSFPSGSSDPSYSGSYTSVSATWTVPTVTSGSSGGLGLRSAFGSSYSAVWTGIDGFTNDDLIQAGTEENYSGGTASYGAWWEILPAAETTISSITVHPGDQVTVTIQKGGGTCGSDWEISLTDTTADSAGRGSPFSTCQAYSGPGASAEWIVEAPQVDGTQSTLADYKTATLGAPSVLQVNGSDVDLASGTGGEMVKSGLFSSSVISVPSQPDSAGDAFTCAYGSSQPAAP